MRATSEQQAAIHIHDKNLIVVAGAGSGKTRVLVERYLQLLASQPRWPINALVAITFTREAAFEMRHRVRLELERRAQGYDGALWARHLSQMDSARIDTIHGLCADILRANAAQAGIDPQFKVLDEVEAAILLSESVEDTLATIDAPLSELFAQYDAYRIISELNRMPLVNGPAPPQPPTSAALFATWQRQWDKAVFALRERLLGAQEVGALAELRYLPPNDKLTELVEQYHSYLADILLAKEAAQVQKLLKDCYAAGAVGNKGAVSKWGSQAAKQAAATALRDLRACIKSASDEIGEPPGALDRIAVQVLPLWQRLLRRVQAVYQARKEANAQLDFDDLEQLTAALLQDKAVQARYRQAEFKHLLVDEFQDTNQAQWRIIQALADLQQGGSLFVVGDPKQSIYQFRGADVSVFNRVSAEIAARETGQALPLATSFRSHHKLVRQFNHLFERLLTRDESSPVKEFEVVFDAPMRAFRRHSPPDPAIELLLLDCHARDETGERKLERGRQKRYSSDEMRHWEAYAIGQRVKELIAQKRQVYDKEKAKWRDIAYGDIAILFQSLTQVTLYEAVFKAQQIPFLTVAGRGYYDRQEVWDMLNLLRFLHNPADNLSLATALRSPIFAFSDDLLFALRLIKADGDKGSAPRPLWQALQVAVDGEPLGISEADKPLLRHALATLTDLRRLAGRVTISELLRRALARTNYMAILTGLPDGARRRGNIEKLLQLAEDSGKITLGKFSQYLADLTAREVREGEALLEAGNALRIMSVHASKGLEFPLVILADTTWERGYIGAPILLDDPEFGLSCQVYDPEEAKLASGFAHRRNRDLQARKEAAERKRLLYVAATRAQDYLLISGQFTFNKEELLAARGGAGSSRLCRP